LTLFVGGEIMKKYWGYSQLAGLALPSEVYRNRQVNRVFEERDGVYLSGTVVFL
jgi:hypothetical protein